MTLCFAITHPVHICPSLSMSSLHKAVSPLSFSPACSCVCDAVVSFRMLLAFGGYGGTLSLKTRVCRISRRGPRRGRNSKRTRPRSAVPARAPPRSRHNAAHTSHPDIRRATGLAAQRSPSTPPRSCLTEAPTVTRTHKPGPAPSHNHKKSLPRCTPWPSYDPCVCPQVRMLHGSSPWLELRPPTAVSSAPLPPTGLRTRAPGCSSRPHLLSSLALAAASANAQ